MIEHVGLDVSTYAPPPSRFEPGTPPIAEAIGMGAAAEYLGGLGLQAVRAYEEDIGRYLYERVRLAATSSNPGTSSADALMPEPPVHCKIPRCAALASAFCFDVSCCQGIKPLDARLWVLH